MGLLGPDEKMIVPSAAHDAPRPPGESHSATGGPPATAIFFSFPCAKKPTYEPSGDQNGYVAPSVPISARDSRLSNGRIHTIGGPSVAATNARKRPSGESASNSADVGPGAVMSKRTLGTPAARGGEGEQLGGRRSGSRDLEANAAHLRSSLGEVQKREDTRDEYRHRCDAIGRDRRASTWGRGRHWYIGNGCCGRARRVRGQRFEGEREIARRLKARSGVLFEAAGNDTGK